MPTRPDYHTVFRALEDNIATREARVKGQRLDLIFETADVEGMDKALARFGGDLSDDDRTALATLTRDEIDATLKIRSKLSKTDLVAHNFGGAIF